MASNQIQFYAKGLDNQANTKIIVRVNNEIIDTVTIDSFNYTMYNVAYTNNIGFSDNVELILKPSGTSESHKAFISFVKVNGYYCYQQNTVTSDDIGLLVPLQTISVNQDSCHSAQTIAACTPGLDKFPPESCNLTNNLIGKKVCDDTGLGYDCEDAGICQPGFIYNNGSCVAQSCVPNSTQSCTIANGVGSQTCSVDGQSYGACLLSSCNTGFHQNGAICEANTQACNDSSGTGTQSWNGTSYGSCIYNSCSSGFTLSNGACIAQSCTPNATQSCTVANGSGTQTCDSQGLSYGSCTANSCDIGFGLNNGVCLALACIPNSTQSCAITNGVGTQTCDAQGSAYGMCTVASCGAGFHPNGNLCESDTRSCTETNGSGTQTWNGSSYGTCTVQSCISDAYKSGNSCVLYCPNPLLLHVVILGAHVCL